MPIATLCLTFFHIFSHFFRYKIINLEKLKLRFLHDSFDNESKILSEYQALILMTILYFFTFSGPKPLIWKSWNWDCYMMWTLLITNPKVCLNIEGKWNCSSKKKWLMLKNLDKYMQTSMPWKQLLNRYLISEHTYLLWIQLSKKLLVKEWVSNIGHHFFKSCAYPPYKTKSQNFKKK